MLAARSAAAMLDHVMVSAYGEVQPLPGLAQVSMKNAQLLTVNPFDASVWCSTLAGGTSPLCLCVCHTHAAVSRVRCCTLVARGVVCSSPPPSRTPFGMRG
ncbi:ribosome recycling factor [archaeon]|nr:MAG: ribosome recycling factor [archaeon]